MSNQNPVIVNLPKEFLDATVKAAMIAAMPDSMRESLVVEIVKQALGHRYRVDRHGYQEATAAEHALMDAVREMATDIIKEWVDGQRESIRKQILAGLDKQALAKKLSEQLAVELGCVKLEVTLGTRR